MGNWKSLIAFLLLTLAVGAFGTLFMPDAWYAGLQKPSFNPPNWVFAPVWSALYILIAIAGWRIYLIAGTGLALSLWIAQLIVNGLWTWLFFGMHRIDLALADMLLLDTLIIAMIFMFYRIDRTAAYLLLPYIAWTSFATVLTVSIWQLNR